MATLKRCTPVFYYFFTVCTISVATFLASPKIIMVFGIVKQLIIFAGKTASQIAFDDITVCGLQSSYP